MKYLALILMSTSVMAQDLEPLRDIYTDQYNNYCAVNISEFISGDGGCYEIGLGLEIIEGEIGYPLNISDDENNDYRENMTMSVKLLYCGLDILVDHNNDKIWLLDEEGNTVEVKAPSNDALHPNTKIFYLSARGNFDNYELDLIFYSWKLDRTFYVNDFYTYVANEIVGSPSDPLVINFGPLDINMENEIISIEMIDEDYDGSICVDVYLLDCTNGSILATEPLCITIVDTTDPEWTVEPSDMVSVACDPATNAATYAAWLSSFSGNDVCGSATVTNNDPGLSNLCGGTGSAIVTFTLTDLRGNDITKDATFTIVDTTPPAITCPASMQTCADSDLVTGAVVIWDEPILTDVCGSASAVSDLLNGGVYSVGITTVTYTATDDCGLTSQCNFNIEVWELPEVDITESELPVYCQENSKILSANVVSNTGGITYSWDTGSTTDTIHVQASGVYNVEVTDSNGCTRGASYNVTVVPQNLLSAYTIIGEDDVHLQGNNVVLNGGVGVLDDKGKAKIHDESFVTGATTFVQSDKIELDNDSGIDNEILTPSTVSLPPFYANLFDSDNDVTVAKNTVDTLTEQVYGKIDVKEGSTVIFTQSDLYIEDLKTKEDVILKFPPCAFVRLEKNLDFYKNVTVNPDGYQVQFFVDSNVEVKEGSLINASIDARGHNMNVKGKDDSPTFMNGQFIGKKVHGDKYVTWDWGAACDPGCEPGPDPLLITCECSGGMSSVTVDYSGGAGAGLTSNDGTVTDNGDGTYTISNGDAKLEKNLEVYDGSNTGQMHTSCSQDILGQIFGGVFTVVAHTDMNNETSTVTDCPNGVDHLVTQVNPKVFGVFGQTSISDIEINTEQSKNITEARLYPNPTSGRITMNLMLEKGTTERLMIYNMLGKVIVNKNIELTSGFNTNEIDLSEYHSGVYFIRVGDLPVKRILVIH